MVHLLLLWCQWYQMNQYEPALEVSLSGKRYLSYPDNIQEQQMQGVKEVECIFCNRACCKSPFSVVQADWDKGCSTYPSAWKQTGANNGHNDFILLEQMEKYCESETETSVIHLQENGDYKKGTKNKQLHLLFCCLEIFHTAYSKVSQQECEHYILPCI